MMTEHRQGRRRSPTPREDIEKRVRKELEDWESAGTDCEDGFTTSHRSVLPAPSAPPLWSLPIPASKKDGH
ncbi:hypothetical protein MEBOL_003558 [Melittangium boletus DSM 14713]|uniref:Uncharacterized protein n=1 Tax=Melittangium boletus DSM 14713 TaxID=1294270 RepID=A0A250IFU5_9BACT|nr:hypothetical protein MEBOL_003558 [Melittangium boletus DSM 14713]